MSVDFDQLGEDFQTNLKEFIEKSSELSKNKLLRVTKALAAYPLEDELIELVHHEEKEVYDIGVQIQSIKLNMIVDSLKQDQEEERIKAVKEKQIQREKNKDS